MAIFISICEKCKRKVRLPSSAVPGKVYTCARCGGQVVARVPTPQQDPQKEQGQPDTKDEGPDWELSPERKGELFLEACPVCLKGSVFRDKHAEDGHTFLCDNCASVLTETIFGFMYTSLDTRFEESKGSLLQQTLTKPELVKMAAEAREEKPEEAPAPAAAEAGREAAGAEKAPGPQQAPRTEEAPPKLTPEGEAPAVADKAAPPGPGKPEPAAAEEEDLWWEIDEEAMAKAGKKAPVPRKKGPVTVDDLLEELGQQPGRKSAGTKPSGAKPKKS